MDVFIQDLYRYWPNIATMVICDRIVIGVIADALSRLDRITLPVIGATKVTMRYKNREIVETVYVLKNLPKSLPSKAASVSLKTISRVDEVSEGSSCARPNVDAEFPKLFKNGLGKLNTDYHMTLQPGAVPFCHTTARTVPHPLLQTVKKELDSMLKHEGITVSTEWCACMVQARQSLCEESKLLTTFIMPCGTFAFNRVSFGISSAPEIFQRHRCWKAWRELFVTWTTFWFMAQTRHNMTQE